MAYAGSLPCQRPYGCAIAARKAIGWRHWLQFRMYYQGELYQKMYGQPDPSYSIRKMLHMGHSVRPGYGC